ncbi:MAG: helix-turn-helix domain-containing protein [Christensenellales bacterium]|jgi:transcriptional regulator with XRE-family HTH domain
MNIKALRIKKGIKQKDLAKSLGISSAYLCELENQKKTNPNINLLMRLSQELGVSINEILPKKSRNET